jgi:hypothetical protein
MPHRHVWPSRRLEEAEELMMQLPSEPSISTLQSLLGACQIHGNMSITERVADMRRQMRERGMRKEIGFSWVDFGASASSHQRTPRIHSQKRYTEWPRGQARR